MVESSRTTQGAELEPPLNRQNHRLAAQTYRVTIRLRGPGGEVGSQGSGVERRRL